MANKRPKLITWLAETEEHDYPAAQSYLNLIYNKKRVAKIIARLRKAAICQFKAKDVFRASRLSLLGVSNSHVEKDRAKILKGKALCPLLLVRDEANGQLIIADGYHRMCAIYSLDEDALVHCKIV